jgi:hypothetical protein
MMLKKRTFEVIVFGMSDDELRMLKSVAWLSTTRNRGYVFDMQSSKPSYDICLVDGECQDAIREWGDAPVRARAPSVIVSAAGEALFSQRGLKRPIVSAKLLALLDEITIKDLHFQPELQAYQDATREGS